MATLQVITGTRAEYGLLRPVLEKLAKSEVLDSSLVVTGSHLSEEFGNTVSEIEKDDFVPVAARIDYLACAVPPGRAGTARRVAMVLERFTTHFLQNRPDGVLVLGDRYEIFAAVQAAALLDIPVAHISGGEVTKGADDDWFRHCISKMSKLHFPSCELHRQRLLKMGERPDRVYNVGGLGDQNIRSMQLLERAGLAESLGMQLDRPYALVTLHPETAGSLSPAQQAQALLEGVASHPELDYIFTKANADAGGTILNEALEAFCQNHDNGFLFASLGVLRYLSAMKSAALVLGNSSSGVVETPSFGVPTINIGQRQQGRMICENVLECPMDGQAIAKTMDKALAPGFSQQAAKAKSPYYGGDTSGKIVQVLEKMLPGETLAGPKEYYDREDAE